MKTCTTGTAFKKGNTMEEPVTHQTIIDKQRSVIDLQDSMLEKQAKIIENQQELIDKFKKILGMEDK